MLKGLLLCAIAVFAAPASVPIESIVGGVPVDPPFKYPWLVALLDGNFQFCGGSLLNENTIITAAHCSSGTVSPNFKAVANRHDLRVSEEKEGALVFKVLKITNHPQYRTSNNQFDASIWKVELIAGNSSAIPTGILQLDDGTNAPNGSEMLIAGWGTTSAGGSQSSILLETTVDIVAQNTCRNAYQQLAPSSICAARLGRDTCQGDSGGPMFVFKNQRPVLVGITSYGRGCALANFPGVYSRVSTFKSWVEGQL
jgi:secreted trypsin-like serine protease